MQPKKDIVEESHDDVSDENPVSQNRIKRYIQIFAMICGIGVLIYNVVFSDDDKDVEVKKTEVKKTFKKEEDVNFSRKKKGTVSANDIEEFIAESDVVAEKPDFPKVAAPDVPLLPDINFDFNKSDKSEEKLTEAKKDSKSPIKEEKLQTNKSTMNDIKNLPELPKLEKVSTSSKKNDFKDLPGLDSSGPTGKIENPDKVIAKKINDSMFAYSNGMASNATSSAKKKTKSDGGDKDFTIYDKTILSEVKKDDQSTANFTQLTGLDLMIAQGKIIDVVLETAINSELPGTVRGMVSRDVFPEAGNKIIIPKGTRVYGTYSNAVQRGQARLEILWNRLIRPDGISISVNVAASDQFGRIGVEGSVDNRYSEIFSNSLLLTFVNLGTAVALQKIGGTANTSATQIVNPNGSVATTTNPITLAANTIIQNTSDIVKDLTSGAMNLKPIVTLPQGTRLKVVVNQDIKLPEYKKAKL